MPAKIKTEQARTLRAARDAARKGNAFVALQCLRRANDLYPVTKRQRAAIQTLLDNYTHENQNRTKAGSSI